MAVKLFLYNSLTKQKEAFTPLSKTVRIYSCGPTVYDRIHIGNLRAFLLADLVVRTLKLNGYKTQFIQNITDVGHLTDDADQGEDKFEKSSREKKKSATKIAQEYTDLFLDDIQKFNLISADARPKATEHIEEQIIFIARLLEKGLAYQTPDAIYFDTHKMPNYPFFPGVSHGDGVSRITEISHKKKPEDFALWKFSLKDEKRQQEWHSPWGDGFPGWHIECSAMSYKYFGFPFDIHTGGMDLRSTHHPNEIAQNIGFSNKNGVRYWLHNEFIMINGEKMSKSLGNTYTLETITAKGYSPLSLRYLFLLTQYRQTLNFTWESLAAADTAYKNLKTYLQRLSEESKKSFRFFEIFKNKRELKNLQLHFLKHLNDDLNTPAALAYLWEKIKDTSFSPSVRVSFALYADKVLGLSLQEALIPAPIPHHITELAQKRLELRKENKWSEADILRKKIEEKGFLVEDTPEGFRILPR